MSNELDELVGDDVLENEIEDTGEDTSSPEVENQVEATEEAEESSETEETAQAPEATEDKEQQGLQAAMLAERQKRQQLQAELEQMRQQSQEQTEKPDFWDEPERVIQQSVHSVEQKMENRFLNMSEYNARQRHEDFDDVAGYFFDSLAQQNPALAQEALQAPDPYEHIYQTAKKHKMVNEVGDMDAYRAKIEAEVRQKVEAEQKAKIEEEIKKRSELPGSLSKESATTGPTGDAEDDDLGSILGR